MKHVKVVKRAERSRNVAAPPAEAGETDKGVAKNREREAAATISRWVTELRDKRRAETRRALASFFGVPAVTRP